MWQIIINGPGYFDTTYDLPEGTTTLGRADENDIVLSGDLVSRKHARLHARGDTLEFEDLGSRNGSRINAQAVQGAQTVDMGDAVAVGENALTVRRVPKSEAVPVPADAGSPVQRMDHALDLEAVVFSRSVRESTVLRALDNVFPLNGESSLGHVPLLEGEAEASGVVGALTVESLALLYKVAESLATAPTLSVFLDTTVELLMRAAQGSTAVVLVREGEGELQPAAVRHAGAFAVGTVPVSNAIVTEAMDQGAVLVVNNAPSDERFARRDSVVMFGAGQVVCIPLGQREPYLGVLYLNREAGRTEDLEPLVELAGAVARLVTTGVEKFSRAPVAPESLRLVMALERAHPPEVAKRRLSDLTRPGATPRLDEAQVTVLFADLAGFSALTRKLPPQVITDILTQFYTRTAQILFSFEGSISTFVGDSVLALFGAPYAKPDDAVRAVRAALTLRNDWQKVMMRRPASERCHIKVGLHTGAVLAGTLRADARADFVAVGEPVNLAAWLVGLAAGDQVLLTGKTRAVLGNRFEFSALGDRPLHPGGRDKISLFEVLEEDLALHTNPGVRD